MSAPAESLDHQLSRKLHINDQRTSKSFVRPGNNDSSDIRVLVRILQGFVQLDE